MFGMIIASGIRSLGKVSFDGNYNLMLVAISIGVSMIPLAAPNFYAHFPDWAQILLKSGITAGSIIAVLLTLYSMALVTKLLTNLIVQYVNTVTSHDSKAILNISINNI